MKVHKDGEVLFRIQNLQDDKMKTVKFSEKISGGKSYELNVLGKILGKKVVARRLTEKNLINTRTREDVLRNKIFWSSLVSGNGKTHGKYKE